MIFCESCAFKQIIPKNPDDCDLVEIKTSAIPSGAPILDPRTGKAKERPQKTQAKKYKCPRCGRGVVAKEVQGAIAKAIKLRDAKTEAERQENDRKKRIQDGLPPERPNLESS